MPCYVRHDDLVRKGAECRDRVHGRFAVVCAVGQSDCGVKLLLNDYENFRVRAVLVPTGIAQAEIFTAQGSLAGEVTATVSCSVKPDSLRFPDRPWMPREMCPAQQESPALNTD